MPHTKFDKEYFSSGSYDEYEKEVAHWVPKVARKIAKFMGGENLRIIDVGCAHGYLLAELQNKYNFEVWGIDQSKFAVKNAERSVRKKIQHGNILDLPHKKNSFDAVVCLDVINYLEHNEVEKAIENLVKVSRKYIFFGAIFKHAWTTSQKWNPDKYRKTVLAKKEYISFFRKSGVKLVGDFDGENGGRVLIFLKRQK